ncbi:MAG: SNF2-related protein, partial [Sedimenticola sp.]
MNIIQLKNQFPPDTLDKAQTLLDAGGVGTPGKTADGGRIYGVIHDNGQTFRTLADRPEHTDITINGECSCAAGEGCAHLCALLLKYFEETEEPQPLTIGANRPPPSERRILIYHLKLERDGACGVRAHVALRSSNGHLERVVRYHHQQNNRPTRYLQPEDIPLLGRLQELEERIAPANHELLRQLLDSGRCYLQESSLKLHLAEEKALILSWQTDAQGGQNALWSTSHHDDLLLSPHPWYLDRETGACGPLQTPLPQPLLEHLKRKPRVDFNEAESQRELLIKLAEGVPLPLPKIYKVERIAATKPVAVLDIDFSPTKEALGHRIRCLLQFEYAGLLVNDTGTHSCFKNGRLLVIERQEEAERHYREQLSHYGLESSGATAYEYLIDQNRWLQGVGSALSSLHGEGWRINYGACFPLRIDRPERWYGSIDEREEGWFDLSVGIELAGEQVNLVPMLQTLIQNDARVASPQLFSQLPDETLFNIPYQERYLALTAGRLRPLLGILFELYRDETTEEGHLRMNRSRAAAHRAAFEEESTNRLDWSEPQEIHALSESLRRSNGLQATTTPKGLTTDLRDYQLEGLSWLQFLSRHGLGAILADDMGLGKTIQALAFLLSEKERGQLQQPALVIAPTSLLSNWRREANRFTPDLSALLLHGPKRKTLFSTIPQYDLIITSYPLLVRDQEALCEHLFSSLILDEAQWVKNPKSQASKVIRELQAENRICLTGTPLENHLGELWALFDFLMPDLLGDPHQFQRLVRDPIEKIGDEDTIKRFARRVRPFLLRRTKEQVLSELPPKTEIVRLLTLEGEQRELYEVVRSAMHEQVRGELAEKGIGGSRIFVLSALLKLRQVCCDPRLVKLEQAQGIEHSAKMEYLTMLLPELVEEGRRILLFSQFTRMLTLIEERVQQLGIDYVKLTGQTRDRASVIDRFQSQEVPLFLISLKAGGVGLNLTAADTVIHYDPWWNPAVERQATDR